MGEYCLKTVYVTVISRYNTEYIDKLSDVKDIGFFKKHVVFWMTDGNFRAYKADNVIEISSETE